MKLTLIAPLPALATVGVASAALGVIAADFADGPELVLLPDGVTPKT
jgi:hypothetical protein